MMKKIRLIIFLVLVIGLATSSYAAYHFYQRSIEVSDKQKIETTTEKSTDLNQASNLVEAVGKLIVLPLGEEPTVATVSDPSKLKDQQFFAKAEVGDKVLIYQKAKQAYLYSVSQNKLIEVAPINVGESASSTSTQKTTP
jgi:hypothetical protein